MDSYHELIKFESGLPLKVFAHSINKVNIHWHGAIEILLVLEGSINVRVGSNKYLLRENDLILINSNEIHSTDKTHEDNLVLALQIKPTFFDKFLRGFSKKVFDCKSFLHKEEQERFDKIRYHIAKIVWELNKKRKGYQFLVSSELLLLLTLLINNFDCSIIDKNIDTTNKDVARINSIIEYIDINLQNGITLKGLSENVNLNPYYLSHYIKRIMGISLQEYLNYKRLDKATELLIRTNKTITEIAFESGFSSTKALNTLIKKEYNITPVEYREKNKKVVANIFNIDDESIRSKSYFDVERTASFSKLYTYLESEPFYKEISESNVSEIIKINADKEGTLHNYYWQNMTTFSRADEGLRKSWQKQLSELQRDIGFKYIRFHGIFSDEMMIFNLNNNGNIIYNWTYVDELFDFFMEVNVKPFIELGFMPSEIKKSDETIFWWKANISQAKDIDLWTGLVREFIIHCINRYGLKEVESWYFEVWNEPELEYVFWVGGKEDYFEFYRETVLVIKSISNELKVGGPSITHEALKEGIWLEDFLSYCKVNNVPLDFVSLHIYPEVFSPEADAMGLMNEEQEAFIEKFPFLKRIYYEENHTYNTLKSVNETIQGLLSYKPEVHIVEWSASSSGRNLISDTCFVATFIIHNVLKSIGQVDSLGYWTFTDIMEEFKLGISHFHGGFGLINKDGLKKPGYFAYYLLSKLGKEIIEQGEDYIVTKQDNNIQILAYNFAYFDDLFIKGDTSALTNIDRYSVYDDKPLKKIQLEIKGVSGKYRITSYKLNREYGSVFDEWVKIGAPENMSKEDIDYLNGVSKPKISVDYIDIDNIYLKTLQIPVHGAELVILEKQL